MIMKKQFERKFLHDAFAFRCNLNILIVFWRMKRARIIKDFNISSLPICKFWVTFIFLTVPLSKNISLSQNQSKDIFFSKKRTQATHEYQMDRALSFHLLTHSISSSIHRLKGYLLQKKRNLFTCFSVCLWLNTLSLTYETFSNDTVSGSSTFWPWSWPFHNINLSQLLPKWLGQSSVYFSITKQVCSK